MAEFFEYFGILCQIHSNNAKELTTQPQCQQVTNNQYGICKTNIEPMKTYNNESDQEIGILKQGGHRFIPNTKDPPELW